MLSRAVKFNEELGGGSITISAESLEKIFGQILDQDLNWHSNCLQNYVQENSLFKSKATSV